METENEIRKRACAGRFETRESAGEPTIECYFAVFDDIYDMGGGITESIDRHAFDDQLDGDVRALIDHDTRLVLGRTTAGTLDLSVDEIGLKAKIHINPMDTDAMNLYRRVQRGDVNQCSFGFEPIAEESEIKENGGVHFRVLKVKLYEGSVVTFPAYEKTEAHARKREAQMIKERAAEAWRVRMKERLKHGA